MGIKAHHVDLAPTTHRASGARYWGAGAQEGADLSTVGRWGARAIWSARVALATPSTPKRAKWRVPNLNSEQQSGLKYQHWISSAREAETPTVVAAARLA